MPSTSSFASASFRPIPPTFALALVSFLSLPFVGFAVVNAFLITLFVLSVASIQQSMAKPSSGAVSTPDRWPSCEHFQEIVTLVVGSEKKTYNVHIGLLSFYSDYFRAAFQGSFKEAIERKMELPGVTKDVFERFQVWLYTRRLDPINTSCNMMARLWIFGDQHQIPLFQNVLMDGMFENRVKQKTFSAEMVSIAYDNTPAGSPLRRAVVEIASTLNLQDPAFPSLDPDHWSVESLTDLVRAVDSRPKGLGQYQLRVRDKCFFHVHGKDEHC